MLLLLKEHHQHNAALFVIAPERTPPTLRCSFFCCSLKKTTNTTPQGCVIRKVGQNRIYTQYMTVYLVMSLPKIPYIHRIYMVLANPSHTVIWTFYTVKYVLQTNTPYDQLRPVATDRYSCSSWPNEDNTECLWGTVAPLRRPPPPPPPPPPPISAATSSVAANKPTEPHHPA